MAEHSSSNAKEGPLTTAKGAVLLTGQQPVNRLHQDVLVRNCNLVPCLQVA